VPVEVDLDTTERHLLTGAVTPVPGAPQATTTAHFAWSKDSRYAFFQQALLEDHWGGVRSRDLQLVRLDTVTGALRTWDLIAPPDDADPTTHNFHSAFYFERGGRPHVGLLRTGLLLASIRPHAGPDDHAVAPMGPSAIWTVEVQEGVKSLQAELLPRYCDLDSFALSHLAVDNSMKDGFILYCNAKQAAVGEETHGPNVYGEPPGEVWEHYSGMTVEAVAPGSVLRYDATTLIPETRVLRRDYDHGRVGDGHTWLPINLQLDSSGERLFASFAGFRPRLLSTHIARAYHGRAADPHSTGYVPPLLIRLNARTLEPDRTTPAYLSYAEPVAFTLAGRPSDEYVCTFSVEGGLRIYDADDLSKIVCEAGAHQFGVWHESHFRTEPAHMEYVPA
jgi:hypothetical protein